MNREEQELLDKLDDARYELAKFKKGLIYSSGATTGGLLMAVGGGIVGDISYNMHYNAAGLTGVFMTVGILAVVISGCMLVARYGSFLFDDEDPWKALREAKREHSNYLDRMAERASEPERNAYEEEANRKYRLNRAYSNTPMTVEEAKAYQAQRALARLKRLEFEAEHGKGTYPG